jgi:hypothetical protein
MLADSVPAEIEVICAVNGTMKAIEERLAAQIAPTHLRFLAAANPACTYPANRLRNLALCAATAEWVCYIDCDFVFCKGFWAIFWAKYTRLIASDDRICLCPIGLWDPHGKYLAVPPSADILDVETFETHRPPRIWVDTSNAELFKYHDRYFSNQFGPGSSCYEMTLQMHRLQHSLPAEPWGILKRTNLPLADEDFLAGPLDKQQLVSAILDRGIRFFAVPDIFFFHMWHPQIQLREPNRVRNTSIWLRRYRDLGHHYLLIGIGGVLPPLLPALINAAMASALCIAPDSPDISRLASSTPEIEACVAAMKSRQRVVVGPSFIQSELLQYGYRVCVLFESPAAYYARATCDSGACEQPSARGEDGAYIKAFCGTLDQADAHALLDNVTVLCDISNPGLSAQALQNVLGIEVPEAWLCNGTSAEEGRSSMDDRRLRQSHPEDYLFYDHARLLAGNYAACANGELM